MKRNYLLLILSAFFVFGSAFSQTLEERDRITENYDLAKLAQMSNDFRETSEREKQYALEMAAVYGWEEFIYYPDGGISELMRVSETGEPIYYTTDNREGGITTRANLVHTGGSSGLDLNGENMTIGIWDGGGVRTSHELMTPRVTQVDGASGTSGHATHVAGTMIGNGSVQGGAVKGMAPVADLWAHDWNSDFSEMTAAAANALLVSNHSYTIGGPLWIYGFYGSNARGIDNIMYNAPYYIPVVSGGNDGNGTYDRLDGMSTAKNNLVVAAVFEVLNYTGPGSVNIVNFSSWGPTDDGRIKPDICGKGANMTSSWNNSNSGYNTISGTSMASPNVAGSILLLQQHYNDLNSEFMLSSTLRGLALHTADEAGANVGPDYRYGWGLLNTAAGAAVITNDGVSSVIIEETLEPGDVYTLSVQSDGANDLMASITWTDPAASLLQGGVSDNPTPSLVNDLDIRISDDGGTTFFPWKLDLNNPTAGATTGDNLVDNIEKIEIGGASGEYIIRVSHKGDLTDDLQVFSLIVTGIDKEEFTVSSHDGIQEGCATDGSASFDIDLGFNDGFSETINFTVTDLPAGTSGVISPTSLSSEGTVSLTVSSINNLSPGDYEIKVIGTGSLETVNVYVILRILDPNLDATNLLLPVDDAIDQPFDITFEWESVSGAQEYEFELATDSGFTSIVDTQTLNVTSAEVSDLANDTEYFWRVLATNICGDSPLSDVFSFTTEDNLGVNDITIEGLVVYPNPVNNLMNVEAAEPITSIELINVLGQSLLLHLIDSNKARIDLSSLSAGNYFARITSENGVNIVQIIKE